MSFKNAAFISRSISSQWAVASGPLGGGAEPFKPHLCLGLEVAGGGVDS